MSQMDRQHGGYRYWTSPRVGGITGDAGFQLHKERDQHAIVAAEIVYCDDSGAWFVETLNGEEPVQIIDELVTEARLFKA